jgi:PAS domain S-box-containing protein
MKNKKERPRRTTRLRVKFPGDKTPDVSFHTSNPNKLTREQLEEQIEMRTNELSKTVSLLKQEVNERWDMQLKLSRHNELLQSLIDNIPVMITLYNPQGEFVLCNREFERLIGWTSTDVASIDLMTACYPDPAYREEIRECMSAAEQGWRDITLVTRDGTHLDTRWANVRLSDGSHIGIGIDIRERKAFEEEMERRKQLAEKRSEQLKQLALQLSEAEELERRRIATILHDDLQQLLVGIKYQVDILAHQAGESWAVEESIKVMRQLLERTITSARNLSQELNPPSLRQLGLHASLRWLARHMWDMYGLVVEVQSGGDAEIADPHIRSFVFRAAQELLFNVVKHGETSRACLSFQILQNRVVFTVEDQGAGFDPALVEQKNGFGLFSIRERVKLMGGTAEITSSPGRGSRISVCFPVVRKVEPDAATPVVVTPTETRQSPRNTDDRRSDFYKNRSIRVLLVDDHKVMRQGLALLLQNHPDLEIVDQAGNGEEGVEKAIALHPNVVLMDVSMPGMDGIEATKRIKSRLADIRIVGLSLFDDPDIAEKMIEAGADSFFTKTGPSDKLIQAIRSSESA